jgi:hypothetical protein
MTNLNCHLGILRRVFYHCATATIRVMTTIVSKCFLAMLIIVMLSVITLSAIILSVKF